MKASIKQCQICQKEFTSFHIMLQNGAIVYVCPSCMEESRSKHIFICVNCGSVHKRDRKGAGNNMQLLYGIDICIVCDPQGVIDAIYKRC